MDIRPIKTDADYEAALQTIDRLMEAELDTPEGDKLDVLVTLVEAYEAKHYPIEEPDPIAAIVHRMEALGLTPKDLEPMLGERDRVAEILERKRPITLNMIRKLAKGLRIPSGVLIQPYEIQRTLAFSLPFFVCMAWTETMCTNLLWSDLCVRLKKSYGNKR